MMELASDIGPAPRQIGAVLLLTPGHRLEADVVRAVIAERLGGIPRLRQRLLRSPWSCGRPVWVDDPEFDIAHHVRFALCPHPEDRAAVLTAATQLLGHRLPSHRPLWQMTLLRGVDGAAVALVVIVHHIITDGMGGLAMLAALADQRPQPPAGSSPRYVAFDSPERAPATPRSGPAAVAAWLYRVLRRLRMAARTLRVAVTVLRPGSTPTAARCSLNRPVGVDRRMITVDGCLDEVRAVARAHRASINDVVLTVVGGALASLLVHRGERVDEVIVSVPVAVPAPESAHSLGNRVAVMPVAVPTGGSPAARLAAVAARTRDRKKRVRGASPALFATSFRLLRALRLLRWCVNHQRLVHTFVTNLRGPDAPISLLGATVDEIVPLNVLAGNVAIDFAVFSYAGSISITVTVDPDVIPELDFLRRSLDQQLEQFRRSCSAS